MTISSKMTSPYFNVPSPTSNESFGSHKQQVNPHRHPLPSQPSGDNQPQVKLDGKGPMP